MAAWAALLLRGSYDKHDAFLIFYGQAYLIYSNIYLLTYVSHTAYKTKKY